MTVLLKQRLYTTITLIEVANHWDNVQGHTRSLARSVQGLFQPHQLAKTAVKRFSCSHQSEPVSLSASEMTYIVSSGALNFTHSLTGIPILHRFSPAAGLARKQRLWLAKAAETLRSRIVLFWLKQIVSQQFWNCFIFVVFQYCVNGCPCQLNAFDWLRCYFCTLVGSVVCGLVVTSFVRSFGCGVIWSCRYLPPIESHLIGFFLCPSVTAASPPLIFAINRRQQQQLSPVIATIYNCNRPHKRHCSRWYTRCRTRWKQMPVRRCDNDNLKWYRRCNTSRINLFGYVGHVTIFSWMFTSLLRAV